MSSKPVKVLVVDNDPAMRRALRNSLIAQGYAVEEARSGEEAVQEISQRPADLVVLDIEMPGIGGMEACRRIRSIHPQAGIIMVTVRDGEDDKIQALEAGADDYITKPFSLRELLARLRAVARRLSTRPAAGTLLRVGELELNMERRSLRRGGVEVHLSPIEFSLLAYLMQHADIPIEHGKLLRTIWGPEYGAELEYLRTYIKRLRKKIENDAMHPEYLLTVPWMGYRFCSPEERTASLRAETAGIAAIE
jgi:two-component system KDP operon response regulator KdpE